MATNGEIKLVPGLVAQIPSGSDPAKIHDVRLSKNGLVYCDCESYRWRGHCSHIDRMIEQNPTAKLIVRAGLRDKIESLQRIIAALDE